jgi:hypothetical protein
MENGDEYMYHLQLDIVKFIRESALTNIIVQKIYKMLSNSGSCIGWEYFHYLKKKKFYSFP